MVCSGGRGGAHVPTLGKQIREARARAGLTTKDAAVLAGISRQEWSRIENGHASEPRPETLGRIERALGIEIRPEEEAGSHVLKLWDLLSSADREQVLADMIRRIPARSFSPADDVLALAAR